MPAITERCPFRFKEELKSCQGLQEYARRVQREVRIRVNVLSLDQSHYESKHAHCSLKHDGGADALCIFVQCERTLWLVESFFQVEESWDNDPRLSVFRPHDGMRASAVVRRAISLTVPTWQQLPYHLCQAGSASNSTLSSLEDGYLA